MCVRSQPLQALRHVSPQSQQLSGPSSLCTPCVHSDVAARSKHLLTQASWTCTWRADWSCFVWWLARLCAGESPPQTPTEAAQRWRQARQLWDWQRSSGRSPRHAGQAGRASFLPPGTLLYGAGVLAISAHSLCVCGVSQGARRWAAATCCAALPAMCHRPDWTSPHHPSSQPGWVGAHSRHQAQPKCT